MSRMDTERKITFVTYTKHVRFSYWLSCHESMQTHGQRQELDCFPFGNGAWDCIHLEFTNPVITVYQGDISKADVSIY